VQLWWHLAVCASFTWLVYVCSKCLDCACFQLFPGTFHFMIVAMARELMRAPAAEYTAHLVACVQGRYTAAMLSTALHSTNGCLLEVSTALCWTCCTAQRGSVRGSERLMHTKRGISLGISGRR
jgi:hypothetical protein